ncbi:uncharacterized protein LOC135833326 [Planococcus citri]|uniref:uncharacterized protein LOC135833326 n=1 Tax=Planococcus citri TaxID=170843 RepID=UPI0031F95363
MSAEIEKKKKSLTREKRVITLGLTRDAATVSSLLSQNPSSTVVNQLHAYMDSWKDSLGKLKLIDDQFMDLIDDNKTIEEITAEEVKILHDYETWRTNFHKNVGKVKTFESKITPTSPQPQTTRRSTNLFDNTLVNPILKLQDIPVPLFDGNYASFPDWWAEFSSMIDSNETFDNFQKLFLLKWCMVGKAEKLLKDIGNGGEVYQSTLADLYKEFFNRRRIISEHFANLFDLPPIKNSTIRDSVDLVRRCLRGLRVCGLEPEKMSPMVAFWVAKKLPDNLRRDWENQNHDFSTYPSFESMATFLINRSFAVETSVDKPEKEKPNSSSSVGGKSVKGNKGSSVPEKRSFVASPTSPAPPKCILCDEVHYLNQCRSFLSKNVSERFEIVKSYKLCLKCFNANHTVSNCKWKNCNRCRGNHNTLLHREYSSGSVGGNGQNLGSNLSHSGANNGPTGQSGSTGSTGQNVPPSGQQGSIAMTNCALSSNKTVFLSTAVVKIQGPKGIEKGRIFFDQGSEVSLVTREFCNRAKLNLTRSEEPTVLFGIHNDSKTLEYGTQFVIKSRLSDFSIAVSAEVVDKIPYSVNRSDVKSVLGNFPYQFAESLDLPYNTVDVLLGSEYVEFVLKEKRYFFEGICLRDSHFGFVISGSARKTTFFSEKASFSSFCGLSNNELSDQFDRFCRIENISDLDETKNETIVEHRLIREHFDKTYSRDENGRFILRLPIKPTVVNLKGSFHKAKIMLLKSERRRSELIRKAYCTFMSEYEHLNHTSKLNNFNGNCDTDNVYYIPHHIVKKETSSTTKYRVFFNASSKDESNTSLNDHLYDGPVIQPELFTNVICFRDFIIAFAADIEHMYHQILMHVEDRKYQRIIWRYNRSDPIETCELNTLTYGTKPAAFLATYCLEKVGISIHEKSPHAAKSIRSHFYIDNLMTGADSVEEAIELQKIIHNTLQNFGFPLRKYMSNSTEVLKQIDSSLIEPLNSRILGGDSFIYVLGLVWCPIPDTLHVMLNLDTLPKQITKRIMLSDVSKVFDVLGMLSPVTVKAKILLQELWRIAIDWDDPISSEIENEFLAYRLELEKLKNFSVPRLYCSNDDIVSKRLIGFSDASTRAYAAVVYIQCVDNFGNIINSFVCAKTRIKPLKENNIHRLELLGALLLANLLNRICNDLKFDRSKMFAFCDSQVTLCWINHPISKLKQFVSNRVEKITAIIPSNRWYYIDTKSNIADLATRGISAENLLKNNSWLNGPTWSDNDFKTITSTSFKSTEKVLETYDMLICFNVIANEVIPLLILNRNSSFLKSIGVMAYAIRLLINVTTIKDKFVNSLIEVPKTKLLTY